MSIYCLRAYFHILLQISLMSLPKIYEKIILAAFHVNLSALPSKRCYPRNFIHPISDSEGKKISWMAKATFFFIQILSCVVFVQFVISRIKRKDKQNRKDFHGSFTIFTGFQKHHFKFNR